VQLAIVSYREGDADYQRVLEAQRALLTEQTALAETRSSIATNLIALYKALGGGWQLHEDAPAVPDATKREMEERTNWGDMLSKPPSKRTE
jgi:outer membrane protein TolC